MNILVANDDGIRADGINALVKALSDIADIYVCAPHIQRSASGHSISIGTPLAAKEVEFEHAKLAIEITGTPADCVKLGAKLIKDRGIKIDMVVSGINHGGNLGTDTLYSGTVSAAMEGAFCGYPSIAVSVNSHNPKNFGPACELVTKVCKESFGKLDSETVLNINVPHLPKEEIQGLKITRLGRREYEEWFEEREGKEGGLEYWYSGQPIFYEELSDDIDVIAMQDGFASITPIHYDLTNHDYIEKLKGWPL